MLGLGITNISGYLDVLKVNIETRRECERLMTVPISRFFRDRTLWRLLQDEVVPLLASQFPEFINVWSAGCARGEEAYSFHIIYNELRERAFNFPQLNLIATDINTENLERASEGVYLKSSLKELPLAYGKKYFDSIKAEKQYRVKPFLKNTIQWERHSLNAPPPKSEFHIIFLRNNILTYYESVKRQKVFNNVISPLKENGFLIIGSHESIPQKTESLKPFHESKHVFVK